MYAILGSNQKNWLWLIFVFSSSGLSVQEKKSFGHPGFQEFNPIPIERIIELTESFQIALFDYCEAKSYQYQAKINLNSSHLQALFPGIKAPYGQIQQDSPANQLAYLSNDKTVLNLRSSQLLFRITSLGNSRIQHPHTEVSEAPYPDEIFTYILPPKHATYKGNPFLVFLIASSMSYIYVQLYLKRKPQEISNVRKTEDQEIPLPETSDSPKIPESLEIPATLSIDTQDKNWPVPRELIQDIWNQLSRFEEEAGYLDKEVNISSLAAQFKTNQRYLSHVINKYKEMPFPTYLKTLRINHASKRLMEEPDLLRYNLEGLADQFGFKTGRSLSIAFYEITGRQPSKVLEELKARERMKNYPCNDDS